jgi:DNA-binding FadR family transcriptional regulator
VPWDDVAALEVKFHDAVARATATRCARRSWLRSSTRWSGRSAPFPVPPGSPLRDELAPELREIMDAIHAGDAEAAGEAMRAHVARWSELEVAPLSVTTGTA